MRVPLLCLPLLSLAAGAAAAPQPTPTRLDLSLPAAPERAWPRANAIEPTAEPRTEIDHRFGPDGLTAEAGYLCGIGGIGPDSAPPGGGPSSLWNHQGTFLGAKLGYPFR
ncbi:MAG TPA: hypothetical protein VGH15_09055 [Caulobacteraceae bacterium]|jgi:hypothetical protein